MSEYRYVATDAGLRDVVAALLDQPRYALDTEFHRERTYWPKVALVQIAWDGDLVLIDPLEVDLAPLAAVLDTDAVAVLHASGQDLEVLDQATGIVPNVLFDTQIAAGFLGMATPSLASLHERELGLNLPKSSRLTDWLERPLGQAQLDYAASDVANLLEIHDRLTQQLTEFGRLPWALAECEIARTRYRGPRDPDEAWRRIKEARHLRGTAISVARSLAGWRERRAAKIDQPPRFVMSDIAVVAVSQAKPSTAEDLARVRGVDKGFARSAHATDVLAAVQEGIVADWRPPRPTRRPSAGRDIRPAVALVAAWVNQVAHDRHLDSSLLATRSDVEALIRGDDDARLATGWRAEIAGEPIRRLVEGTASLAFDDGSVVLEDRSGVPIV